MKLTDLPPEILLQILSEVYQPWWIEATRHPSKEAVQITARPRLPSTSPLLSSRALHNIGKNLPLCSFNGLLDIRTRDFSTSVLEEWKFIEPLLERVWMGDYDYLSWGGYLASLPSVRVIEIYSEATKYLPREVRAGSIFPPTTLWKATYWFSKQIQDNVAMFAKDLHKDLQICGHIPYIYEPEVGSVNAIAIEGCVKAKTIKLKSWGCILDLVYAIYGDGRCSDQDELLHYRKRTSSVMKRSDLAWLGVSRGFYDRSDYFLH